MADDQIDVKIAVDTSDLPAAGARYKQLNDELAATSRTSNAEMLKLAQQVDKLASELSLVHANAVKYSEGLGTLDAAVKANILDETAYAKLKTDLTAKFGQEATAAQLAAKEISGIGLSSSQAVNGARALFDELASGRDRQATGTFARLAIAIGTVNPAAVAATAVILALGGALAYGAVRAYQFAEAQEGVNNALLATGQGGKVSQENIDGMVRQLSKLTSATREEAGEVVAAFAHQRNIGTQAMNDLVNVVGAFAVATKQKMPEAAAELSKAFADPATGIVKLREQLGLTDYALEHAVKTMAESGNISGAQNAILAAMIPHLKDVVANTDSAALSFIGAGNKALEFGADLSGVSNGMGIASGAIGTYAAHLETLRSKNLDNLSRTFIDLSARTKETSDANQDLENNALRVGDAYNRVATESEKIKANIVQMQTAQAKMASDGKQTSENYQRLTADIAAASQQLQLLKNPGDATQFQKWKADLQEIKTEGGELRQQDLQADITYWNQKLALVQTNSRERVQIQQQISQAEKALSKQSYELDVKTLEDKKAATQKASLDRIAIDDQEVELARKTYTEDSVQYKSALAKKIADQRDFNTQVANLENQRLQAAYKASTFELDIQRENDKFAAEIKGTSNAEMFQKDQALEQQRYALEQSSLNQRLAIANLEPSARQKINEQVLTAAQQHALKMLQLSHQETLAYETEWKQSISQVTGAFKSGIQGMINGTQTFQQATASVLNGVVGMFLSMGQKLLEDWIMTQIGMTTSQASQDAARQAAQDAVNIAGGAEAYAQSIGIISNHAAEAAAAAFAATAAIPIVGPGLAPEAAAGAYAATQSFSAGVVPFAEQGFDVPGDGMAYLHKKEMVLPQPLAEGVRNMVDQGTSGGGGMHLHIHAVDASGVSSWFDRNKNNIAGAMRSAQRNFAV